MDKIINLISLDRCAFDTMKLFLHSAYIVCLERKQNIDTQTRGENNDKQNHQRVCETT